jgi:hypothetical protein
VPAFAFLIRKTRPMLGLSAMLVVAAIAFLMIRAFLVEGR